MLSFYLELFFSETGSSTMLYVEKKARTWTNMLLLNAMRRCMQFNSIWFTCSNLYNFLLAAPQEIDESKLVDPVDILTSLDKSGFWDGGVCAILVWGMPDNNSKVFSFSAAKEMSLNIIKTFLQVNKREVFNLH